MTRDLRLAFAAALGAWAVVIILLTVIHATFAGVLTFIVHAFALVALGFLAAFLWEAARDFLTFLRDHSE